MVYEQKIVHLALAVMKNHGDEAFAVASDRARMWLDAEDFAWAAVWIQVAEKICSMRHEASDKNSTVLAN